MTRDVVAESGYKDKRLPTSKQHQPASNTGSFALNAASSASHRSASATLQPPDTAVREGNGPPTRTSRFLRRSRSRQHIKETQEDIMEDEGLPPRSSSSSSTRDGDPEDAVTPSQTSLSGVSATASSPAPPSSTTRRSPVLSSPPHRNGGNIFAFSSPPRQSSQDTSRSVGGWFSNILSNSQSQTKNTQTSPRFPDDTASVPSFASAATSPSRFLSRKSVRDSPGRRSTFASVTYGGQPSGSSQTQEQGQTQMQAQQQHSQPVKAVQNRMGGFDRIFDRALQFFTDADSNVDRNPEDIWLMGVRHDGWRPEGSLSPTTPADRSRPSLDTVNSENYFQVSDPSTSGLPKPHATRQIFSSNGRRLSKSSSRIVSSKETSASPPSKELPASPTRQRSEGLFANKVRKNTAQSLASTAQLMDRSSSGSSSSSGAKRGQVTALSPDDSGTVPLASNSEASGSHASGGKAQDDAASILSYSTVAQSTVGHHAMYTAPISTAQTMGWPPDFYLDFYSRIQLTYRSGFSPLPSSPSPPAANPVANAFSSMMSNLNVSIGRTSTSSNAGDSQLPQGLTTDSGWGCMLRTGQSLLANTLIDVHLGRDFRRPLPHSANSSLHPNFFSSHPLYSRYVRLVSWFFDNDSPSSPFSVHKFAVEGKKLGKQIGEWFGPSTAAGAIKVLANSFAPAHLGVAMAIDTTVYGSEVFHVARGTEPQGWHRPVLILIPLRLGLNGVNPIYYNSMQHYFTLPQCVGIAGGRPSSSYYFVGAQGTQLFYIDPHHTKPTVKAVRLPGHLQKLCQQEPLSLGPKSAASGDRLGYDDLSLFFANAYRPEELESFHCDKVRKMAFGALDPSMLVGLLCQSKEDWDDLCARMKAFPSSKDHHPLLHIAQEMPAWMRNPSRTMSGSGAPRQASTSAHRPSNGRSEKIAILTVSAATEAAAAAATSPDDVAGTSFDYADSDDWDIDESDGEACESASSDHDSIVVEAPGASPSKLSNVPAATMISHSNGADSKVVSGTPTSTSALDDFEQINAAGPDVDHSSSPPVHAGYQETDAFLVLPQNDPHTPESKGRELSLEPEDRDAGWEAYPSRQVSQI